MYMCVEISSNRIHFTMAQAILPYKDEIRRHLLPVYSHIDEKDESCLLLANVSCM